MPLPSTGAIRRKGSPKLRFRGFKCSDVSLVRRGKFARGSIDSVVRSLPFSYHWLWVTLWAASGGETSCLDLRLDFRKKTRGSKNVEAIRACQFVFYFFLHTFLCLMEPPPLQRYQGL